jgi:hypothetical protein
LVSGSRNTELVTVAKMLAKLFCRKVCQIEGKFAISNG